MNRLRRLGLIRYSRKHIDVFTEAIIENLRQQRVCILGGARAAPADDVTRRSGRFRL